MDQVHGLATMRMLLQQWIAEDARHTAPASKVAIELTADGTVIGGAALSSYIRTARTSKSGGTSHRDGVAGETTKSFALDLQVIASVRQTWTGPPPQLNDHPPTA